MHTTHTCAAVCEEVPPCVERRIGVSTWSVSAKRGGYSTLLSKASRMVERAMGGAAVCSVRPAFCHGIMFRVDRCATRVLERHKGAHRGEEEAGVG